MKNRIIYFFVALLIVMSGCHKPDVLEPDKIDQGLNSITAQPVSGALKDDETARFTTMVDESLSTITIKVPWYFPASSDYVVTQDDLKAMKLTADLAANYSIEPKLGTWDLTKDHDIEVVKPDGTRKKYTIKKAEIYKLYDCDIKTFAIDDPMLNGIVDDDKISLITLDELKAATATVIISSHATISPNPATVQDYSNDMKFTVTAHDGVTKKVYTVSKVVPNKITYGFRSGSEKEIWKSIDMAKDYGIVNASGRNYNLGAAGNHLVLCDGVDFHCFNRLTGVKTGTLTLGGISVNSVTNDAAGNLILCNVAGPSAVFSVYKTNSIGTAPTKVLDYTNGSGATMGKKISVDGDINGDATISAVIYTWNGAVCKFITWNVVGGVAQAPKMISVTGATAGWNGNGNADAIASGDNLYLTYYSTNNLYRIANSGAVSNTITCATWGANSNFNCIDAKVFNGARYVAVYGGQHFSYSQAVTWMFDVTQESNFTGKMDTSPAKVFVSNQYQQQTMVAASSDVILVPSVDGYKMHLYYTDANSKTLVAWEFDCIDK